MFKKYPLIWSGILLAALGLLGGFLLSGDTAVSASDYPLDIKPQADKSAGEWLVVRIYYNSRAELDAVAGQLDIWHVDQEAGYALAMMPPAQYDWLEVLGYKLVIDEKRTAEAGIQAPLDSRFYYYDEDYPNPNGLYITDFLAEVNASYPNLTELIDIGDAWQGLNGLYARDIWVLRITNEDPAYGAVEDKPPFFLFGGIHAREVAIPELAIRYIQYLTSGYNGEGGYRLDPDVTWLVNHNVVYILVTQNPDGHRVDEQDIDAYRRKNMDSDDGCNDYNTWGVDLNRNSSFYWGCCGGSSSNACSETYRGPSAGSEPETQAFQTFFASVMPDHNGNNGNYEIGPATPLDAPGIFLSLHSYSDLVLWPWSITDGDPPNLAQLTFLGQQLGLLTGYGASGDIGYAVDGATDDWTYGKLGIASFTFEIGSDNYSNPCGNFFPNYGCIDGTDGMVRSFWDENRPAFLYLHKIASMPFTTVYGPDAENVIVSSPQIQYGEPVTLTALIAEHRYTGTLTPVAGAEFFIDAPGEDGTGTAMDPLDGSWGETSEEAIMAVDTTGLSQGMHYILVHGMSNQGKWGPFTAVFLLVIDPAIAPTLQGQVRDAGNWLPLPAELTAGLFATVSDPSTGLYSMQVLSGTYAITADSGGYVPQTFHNVAALDHQTVTQNFDMVRICETYNNDVETGALGWSAQSPWGITTLASHSPTHAWTDSPSGSYANNLNISLTSPALDMSDHTGVSLTFWHKYQTEPGYDYGYVEYSIDGGAHWSTAGAYNGYQTTWTQASVPLPALDGQSNVRLRFRFTSDGSQVYDGWYIDDIALQGASISCSLPMAPVADFNSPAEVTAGDVLTFTNLTIGTQDGMTYAWDFGDNLGTSTQEHPVYVYAQAGTYTATLTASNGLGSDTAVQQITIQPGACLPLEGISLTVVTTGTLLTDAPVAFSADLSPDEACKPYTYTVAFGDGVVFTQTLALDDPLPLEHTYTFAGTYTVTIAAWNAEMSAPVSTTVLVVITEPTPLIHTYLPQIVRGGIMPKGFTSTSLSHEE